MKNLTKKQEETLREFLHEAVVPLIEDVLVKKLGQAMSYAKEQFAPPSKQEPFFDITAAVDAAMVEMKNLHPPMRRSECERLIKAALYTGEKA